MRTHYEPLFARCIFVRSHLVHHCLCCCYAHNRAKSRGYALRVEQRLLGSFGLCYANVSCYRAGQRNGKGKLFQENFTQAGILRTFTVSGCYDYRPRFRHHFWLNWGFALIFSAMLAKEMARQVKCVDYRLLVAAGYGGIAITQCGVGGSVLLTIAAPGGVSNVCSYDGAIPLSQTVFAPGTLIACGIIIVMLPILFKFMTPDPENTYIVDPAKLEEKVYVDTPPTTPSEKLEVSKILWAITWIAGLAAFIYVLIRSNFDLNINSVNFLFLFLGILCHGNLKRYIRAFQESASAAGPILLQFPFYAGIMGMMTAVNADGISLAIIITNGLLSISTVRTLPVFTWLSAAILNFFIPSGGGQWAVQAPIMLNAAMEKGVSLATVSTALLWGDAWTNLIQPFWALPALSVAGLAAKDIMGYLVIVLFATGIVVCGALLFLY